MGPLVPKANNGSLSSKNGTSSSNSSNNSNNRNKNAKDTDWSTAGDGMLPGRELIGPVLLMMITPYFAIIFFHVCANMNGNFIEFGRLCYTNGSFLTTVYNIWPTPWDRTTWIMISTFLTFQLVLMKIVPGKQFIATMTATGHRPIYKANGTASFIITLLTTLLVQYTGLFRIALVYDKFGNILSSMNVFAWIFCTILLIKGYVAPSGTDHGTNGSLIMDFYWGMELFPRIGGWDVKQFTNCRAGLMFWAVALICFCAKNMELNTNGTVQYGLAVSVILQLIYLAKFYHWEMGYMCSMDIQVDRAGYYICWGCLVWVPAVYTSAAFYLTTSAPDISSTTALLIVVAGTTCIWINYDSDRQRYIFRQSAGQCTIWGSTPPSHIVAKYQTSSGDIKTSLLLTDGWWKISRHFHYVPEILASFFWSVSALNTGFIGPYFYVIYLTILLTDRAFRDDSKCRKKYGPYWDEYCSIVPYKIIPGIV